MKRDVPLLVVLLSIAGCSGPDPTTDRAAAPAVPPAPKSLEDLRKEQYLLHVEAAPANAAEIPKVVGLLEDPEPRIRVWAAGALAALGDPQAVAPLVVRLTDEDKHVRVWAVSALGRLGDKSSIEPISKLLSDPEEVVRVSALTALVRLERSASAQGKYDPKGKIYRPGNFFAAGMDLLKQKPEEAILALKKEEHRVAVEIVSLESSAVGGKLGRQILELKKKQSRTSLSKEEMESLRSLVGQIPNSDVPRVFGWVQGLSNLQRMLTVVSQLQERGVVLMSRSKYLAMARENPQSLFAQYRLGQLHFWAGETAEAAATLKNAVGLDPRDGDARLLLGKVLIELERYPEAEEHIRAARQYGQDVEESVELLKKKGHWKADPSATPSQ